MAAPEEDKVLTARAELQIPEGEYVEQTLFLVSYIDGEGNHKYAWSTAGGGSIATTIGLMRMVEFSALVEAMS